MGFSIIKSVVCGVVQWQVAGILVRSDQADASGSENGDSSQNGLDEYLQDLSISDQGNESSTVALDSNVEQDDDEVKHMYFQDDGDNESSISIPDDVSEASSVPPICKDLPSGHNVNRAIQQARINSHKKDRKYHSDFSDTASVATEASSLFSRVSAKDQKDPKFTFGSQFLGDALNQIFTACRTGDATIVKRIRDNSNSDTKNIDINKVTGYSYRTNHFDEDTGHFSNSHISRANQARHGVETDHGLSPLLLATGNNHQQVVRELLQFPNIDPNIEDIQGQTALCIACAAGYKEIVDLLIKDTRTDVNINSSLLPLLFAAGYNRVECVKILLQHEQIKVNQKCDLFGQTALMVACAEGRTEVVKVFLGHDSIDADIKESDILGGWTNLFGSTASDRAKNHPLIVQMLKEHSAQKQIEQKIAAEKLRNALEYYETHAAEKEFWFDCDAVDKLLDLMDLDYTNEDCIAFADLVMTDARDHADKEMIMFMTQHEIFPKLHHVFMSQGTTAVAQSLDGEHKDVAQQTDNKDSASAGSDHGDSNENGVDE